MPRRPPHSGVVFDPEPAPAPPVDPNARPPAFLTEEQAQRVEALRVEPSLVDLKLASDRRELRALANGLLGLGGDYPQPEDCLVLTGHQLRWRARKDGIGRLPDLENVGYDTPVQPRRPGHKPYRLADEDIVYGRPVGRPRKVAVGSEPPPPRVRLLTRASGT